MKAPAGIFSGPALAAALTIAASLMPSPAAAYHFEDSLRGSTQGNQLGGTLTADGWRVDSVSDRIWYTMPTLPQGSIEFTLAGVSNDRFMPADHEMFTIYEGGYGISEPVDYGHLKPMFYRVMWRLRGEVAGVDGETVTHQGEQKFIWIMCPDGAPGYAVDSANFCKCSQWLDAGPSGGDMTWTGVPERIRFEWDSNGARYLRNGTVIDTIDWTGTGLSFAPSEPHFCLGSPRAGAVSYAVTVPGAVYSDLVVDGVEGPQAVCPGTVTPDGGTPDTGVSDAGTGKGTEYSVLQDVTAASWESGVYSLVDDLNGEGPSGGLQGSVIYLKFPAAGGTPGRAILKLHTSTIAGARGGSGRICHVDDDSWSESTLTWANRPAVSGICAGNSMTVDADQEVEFDVTSIVGGLANENLAIVSSDADGVHYYSKESGGTTLGPRLQIELAASPDAGVQDAADDGSLWDAAPAGDGSQDSGGGADHGGEEDAHHAMDTGAPTDAGAATDTGPADAGTKKDAGAFSYDTVGCGCTTVGLQ